MIVVKLGGFCIRGAHMAWCSLGSADFMLGISLRVVHLSYSGYIHNTPAAPLPTREMISLLTHSHIQMDTWRGHKY